MKKSQPSSPQRKREPCNPGDLALWRHHNMFVIVLDFDALSETHSIWLLGFWKSSICTIS